MEEINKNENIPETDVTETDVTETNVNQAEDPKTEGTEILDEQVTEHVTEQPADHVSSDQAPDDSNGSASKSDIVVADPNFVIVEPDSTSYETVHENDAFELVKEAANKKKLPEGEHGEAPAGRASRHHLSEHKSPNYITKKAFVITLIIAILLTAVLSTAASVLIIKNTSDSAGSYSNLTSSSIDSSSGSKLSTQEIIAKNIDAVVEINTSTVSTNMFGQQQVEEGAGSGVIVNKDGYIATNNHVIEDAKKISVTLHNGKSYNATLVGTDAENDIAVIKINASNLTVATLGDSSKLSLGDQTVAIGNPLGSLGGTATTGIISALERRLTINNTTLDLLQTDAAINPGNSGGGLFNGAGELVGIVVAKSSGTGIEGLGFAIPINSVGDIIDSLIDTGKVPDKGYIGINIRDIDSDYAEYYQLDGAGVYVVDVTSEAAQKAGFQVGDRLISIDGNKASSASDFIARVHEHKIGDTVSVVIERDGQQKTIKVKLQSQNSGKLKSDSKNLDETDEF